MPTFPTYPGELPACLDPLNPRHYTLLAYWIFFRPTALKCYLYQADPELYKAKSGLGIFHSSNRPAYRNLYAVALGTTVTLLLVMISSLWLVSSIQYIAPNWLDLIKDMIFGVILGVILGVVVGFSSDGARDTLTVGFGVAFSVYMGLILGITAVVKEPTMEVAIVLSIFTGLVFSALSGIAWSMLSIKRWAISLGVLVVLIFPLRHLWPLMESDFNFPDIITVMIVLACTALSALRLPMYLIQIPGILNLLGAKRHPIWWDELAVLPLFGAPASLRQVWQQGEEKALRRLGQLATNPFQRWALQRTLYEHCQQKSIAIPLLYKLFSSSSLDFYAIAPVTRSQWQSIPSARQVLVGGLAGCGYHCALPEEYLVWQITYFLRARSASIITDLAKLLYDFKWWLDISELELLDFHLIKTCSLVQRFIDYPGAQELQQSFEAMLQFRQYVDLSDLGQAPNLPLPPVESAIRPTVIKALHQFQAIKQDIIVFNNSTSRLNKSAALSRASGSLESLQAFIQEVILPEQVILQAILNHWHKLVSDARSVMGNITIDTPVPNPYVAGNPVVGHLFVGRQDILRELEELWLKPGQVDSVVIYGHRRMGKSSILKNLSHRLDAQRNWVVDFNLQSLAAIHSTGGWLYALALALYDRLPSDIQPTISEPNETDFFETAHSCIMFRRWLQRLDPVMTDRRFIVAVDEYELLKAATDEGHVDPSFPIFLRGLIQDFAWFVLILAGLYNLGEQCHDYWNPFFSSIKDRKVSFLSLTATRKLITEPSPDFLLDYTPEVLDEIVRLTHGQPYLVQLIGQNLVTQFNRQVFEEGQASDRPISLADLHAVINSPILFQDGVNYFSGVWGQAETSEPPGQTDLLRALSSGPLTFPELVAATGLSPDAVTAALKTLCDHDVVIQEGDRLRFTVELMRRWVHQRS